MRDEEIYKTEIDTQTYILLADYITILKQYNVKQYIVSVCMFYIFHRIDIDIYV